ncbi:MAG TPA: efflux RND transporter periplasmic adaptor subunit [Gemmataceae bacterium]|jgi:multidrug resistance efflux pump|nr:efflux RND transporter periplasmic adaptor subunit [Gemmataceae bacterium]
MTEHPDGVAVNGSATLADRVKELDLAGKLDVPKHSSGTAWLPWLLCGLLAFGWAGFAIMKYRPPPPKAADPSPAANTAKATVGADAITLEVKGYLIPTQSISISPIDVAGRVVKLNIEEGMSFKKGDVLAEIDSTPYEALKAEATANVAAAKARFVETDSGSRPEEIAQAKAELDEAKALLEQFRREWQRFETQKTLSITTREYEQAESSYRSQEKRVESKKKAFDLIELGPRKERKEAAKAEYDSALARLRQADWKIENCTIKSPVTGVILTKKAEIGSLLNPVVGGVSTNLCDIADLRKLEVDLEVNERDIAKVRLDQECRIKTDAYPDRPYEGFVERVMPIANRAKSVVPVRIKVIPREGEKQGQYLKPEMGVTVTFLNRQVNDDYKKQMRKRMEDDADAPK